MSNLDCENDVVKNEDKVIKKSKKAVAVRVILLILLVFCLIVVTFVVGYMKGMDKGVKLQKIASEQTVKADETKEEENKTEDDDTEDKEEQDTEEYVDIKDTYRQIYYDYLSSSDLLQDDTMGMYFDRNDGMIFGFSDAEEGKEEILYAIQHD